MTLSRSWPLAEPLTPPDLSLAVMYSSGPRPGVFAMLTLSSLLPMDFKNDEFEYKSWKWFL